MSVVEMRKFISGIAKKDDIRNEEIHLKIGVTPIDEKTRESHLRWFGYVRVINALESKGELMQGEGMKKKVKEDVSCVGKMSQIQRIAFLSYIVLCNCFRLFCDSPL